MHRQHASAIGAPGAAGLVLLALLATEAHHWARAQQNSSIGLARVLEAGHESLAGASVADEQQQQQQQQQFGQLEALTESERDSVGAAAAHSKSHLIKATKTKSAADKRKKMAEQTASSLASSMLRAYIRTNNMRAYHLDLHSYRPEKLLAGDPAHVDSSNSEHQLRCHKHLLQYHRMLKSFSESDPMDESTPLEALKLADMFGKPPAGLLEGNQFWLGAHDTCRAHELVLGDGASASQPEPAEAIQSHYCLGLAQFPSWNPRDTKTSIKIGLCLPETCTSSMFLNDNSEQQVQLAATPNGRSIKALDLVEEIMKLSFGAQATGHFNKLKLRSVYCLPHESSEIRQFSSSAWALIGLLSSFCLLAAYATAYDYLNNKLEREKNELVARRQIVPAADQSRQAKRSVREVIIESFSIIRNIEKFMHVSAETSTKTSHDSSSSSLDEHSSSGEFKFNNQVFSSSITGLKCLGLIWIIAAHTFLVSPIAGNNLVALDKLTSTIIANVYLSAHLMVDTFFALSGLLASYLLFRSGLGTVKASQWILLTVHRYWRLTPVYLLSYWFTKSLGHQLNSGPLWDFATAEQSPRYRCEQESWAEAIFHLSDFKSPKDHCVPFAWFIANGIKFWIVTPFIVTAIHKCMRRGYQITGALILANMALVAKLAFSSNVDMKSVIEFKPESADNMLNNMDQVYTRPYSRIGAYLIGLLAGHFFYRIETKQLEVNLSKNMQVILWTLFACTTIVLTFMLKLANGLPIDDSAIPIVFALCSALIRPLWALCSCWLVFALAHGQARWLAKFLSGNLWKILVKLSFCAYLAQGEVIAHLYLAQSHSNAFTYSDLITRPIVATVLTMAVSLVILLLVEYPLVGIEELILPMKKSHAAASKHTESTNQSEEFAKADQQSILKHRRQPSSVDAIELVEGEEQRPVQQAAGDSQLYSCKQRKQFNES